MDKAALKDARILIVEDEPDTRDMLVHALKRRGAKPLAADAAKQALQRRLRSGDQ
jgi:CheY-like chemotaxis protein